VSLSKQPAAHLKPFDKLSANGKFILCKQHRGKHGFVPAPRPAYSGNIAIHIEPQPLYTHKAADFMQPMRTAIHFVTRDEFDHGMIRRL